MATPENKNTTPYAVYVAASAGSDDANRVRRAIIALRASGFVVTCTWPEVVAATPGGSNPRDASTTDRFGWSTTDLNEIDAAHAVWFLVPTPPVTTRGAWFEAGYAHAQGKHLAFSGDTKQSVFCALGREFDTDEAAIAHLHRLRVERGMTELAANAPAQVDINGRFDTGGEG